MPNQLAGATSIIGNFWTTPGNGTQAMNTALKWVAFSFVAPPGNLTLSNFVVNMSAISGTQANISVSCEIYSDVTAVPGAALSSAITITNTAAGWWSFNGLNQATVAGTRYWAVFKNTAAVPATDYPTIRWSTGMSTVIGATGAYWGDTKHYTADGSAWSSSSNGIAGYRIDWSNSTYSGLPVIGALGTNIAVYGAREGGVVFTSPAYATLRVAGAILWASKVTSPAGNAFIRLRYGASSADAYDIAPDKFVASQSWPQYFASIVSIPPSTACRLTLVDDATDDSSNYFRPQVITTIHDDANSRTLLYLGAVQTSTTDNTANPIVWTDTNMFVYPWALILDTAQEFGASGGMIVNPGMTGGMRG